ncbi:pyridoxal phosphate-dependent transferase [Aspergillus pseudoustus]|uniref:Molybdenum cofactor sulfurase n=1 Tax=Aspergillus pseudoustus TaxID=1810923 RepID=A0ABR4JMJ9_9EURO
MGYCTNDIYPPAAYCSAYSNDVDVIRELEYPLLKDTTYLDHAGTTLYAKSLIDSFSRDMTSNLYGNPHSLSASSQLSSQRVDDIRLKALQFFNASPDDFDLIFVANATAAIKLVVDSFRDSTPQGFWYGYHVDAHTSLVGARELAGAGSRCFVMDEEVEKWIFELGSGPASSSSPKKLFAYPGQSNMNGRRFPMRWCKRIREKQIATKQEVYTLLDAASLVSTSPLDLSDPRTSPDFTVLSFYKIFGFPDLGALIVRKSARHIFDNRKFFGGGTVDMVLTTDDAWHAKKQSIHERLEDGTLPFHSIIALGSAFETHRRLYGSMENVSSHARFLAKQLYQRMTRLRHYNGTRVCELYVSRTSDYSDPSTQGPIVAFNLRSSRGMWVGKSEVERLASIKNIQLRSGTLCNPGGTAMSLGWTGADMLRHFSSGMRCGDDNDIMDERPTGILRVSLGAMSSQKDIDAFMAFLEEFYVDKPPEALLVPLTENLTMSPQQPSFYVESLSVYPIKSCGAFRVPDGLRWQVRREGLAWDREWCLVHQGTGVTLNQKRCPRMALIRPTLDLARGLLRITCGDGSDAEKKHLDISIRRENMSSLTTSLCQNASKPSTVCGDKVVLQVYTAAATSSFFTEFLGVPCTLARFPPQSSTRSCVRRGVGRDRSPAVRPRPSMPGSFPQFASSPSPTSRLPSNRNPILLSNESPLLLISRSSVNRLNESIKSNTPHTATDFPSSPNTKKAVAADVFRANIVIAENQPIAERPYIEDTWRSLSIGPVPGLIGSEHGYGHENEHGQLRFEVLGSCERCQMVCVDQYTGTRGDEPYATLAKTRKVGRKILFGRHISPVFGRDNEGEWLGTVMVGDVVRPNYDDDDEDEDGEGGEDGEARS